MSETTKKAANETTNETTNEAANETTKKTEERVEIFIPRGRSNEDPNYFISVNGVNYLLPRGKKSLVPKCVAAEYNRAQEAEAALYAKQDEMIQQSKQPIV